MCQESTFQCIMEPGIVAPEFLTNSIEIILISEHEHWHGHGQDNLFLHPQTNFSKSSMLL